MPNIPFALRTQWKLATNDLTRAIGAMRASGQRFIDLTESNPTQVGLTYASRLLEPLASSAGMQYEPHAAGMLSARQAVTDYYGGRSMPMPVQPEAIILTTSTSEGYAHTFRLLCDPGDEVLVPAPSYPLLQFLADLHDVKLVHYELIYDHGWQIDFPSLRSAITPRSRAVVLVHPNNPTGSYVSAREREELNRIAQEFGLALIVDEVFLDYVRHDAADSSASEASDTFAGNIAALTLTLSGLSKVCCLPQMKLGWMVVSGPGDLARAALSRLEIIADTFLSVGTPVQLAVRGMLEQRHSVQRELGQRLRTNLAALDRSLLELPACDRLQVQGGWYAVIRVPATGSDEALAVALLERRGVLVHPGHFFDFAHDGYLVVSLIPQEKEFAEGMHRLVEGLRLL